MPNSVVLPPATVLGFAGSLGADGWARLHRAQQEVNYKHGVFSGLGVAAAGGVRGVQVAAGVAVLPGLRIDVPATVLNLDENLSGATRRDTVVLEADWNTSVARLLCVKGSASAPSLKQAEGDVWQMPLMTFPLTNNSASVGTPEPCAPQPRLLRVQEAALSMQSVANGGAAKQIASMNLPDPGWPYRLRIDAAIRCSAANGSSAGILSARVDGTEIARSTTPPLAISGDAKIGKTLGVRTGPAAVSILLSETGSATITMVDSANHQQFQVTQIPA